MTGVQTCALPIWTTFPSLFPQITFTALPATGDQRTSRQHFPPLPAQLFEGSPHSPHRQQMADPGAGGDLRAVLGLALFMLVTSLSPIASSYGVFLLRNKLRRSKQKKMKEEQDLRRHELFRREQELRAQVAALQAALARKHALAVAGK